MSIISRIKKVETSINSERTNWLNGLPDDELERFAASGGSDPLFTGWLQTLTDDELLTIRDGRLGAKRLLEKFDEYQKQAD